MDIRLYQASYLAIPLLHNEGHGLSPQPNFLVIDKIQGRGKAVVPTMGEIVVSFADYKIVYREILQANEQLGRGEEVREIVYDFATQVVPMLIVPALSDYEYLSQSIAQVNGMLSLFQFRGVLSGFQLIIDESKMSEIIVSTTTLPITTTENIITTTLEVITTTQEVTTTENIITTTLEEVTTTVFEEITTTENITTTTEPITTTTQL